MPIFYDMSDCHPLEVVDRGSEAQLQMGEKLNFSVDLVVFDENDNLSDFVIHSKQSVHEKRMIIIDSLQPA